ncbi:MAG: hypothetical protein JWO38_6658 [Gemmataceae bacterium]|nr:hypothetical protein [Gemmataceae bacterium]
MSSRSTRFLTAGMLVVLFCALVGGCGPDYKARAVVKGKVTVGGKPLTSGTVMFYGNNNNITSSAVIDTDGSYAMNDAPLGPVQVTVTVAGMPPGPGIKYTPKKGLTDTESKNPSGEGESIPLMSKMPSTVVRIPDKFSKPETSGLTYTVEKGEHAHNIEL